MSRRVLQWLHDQDCRQISFKLLSWRSFFDRLFSPSLRQHTMPRTSQPASNSTALTRKPSALKQKSTAVSRTSSSSSVTPRRVEARRSNRLQKSLVKDPSLEEAPSVAPSDDEAGSSEANTPGRRLIRGRTRPPKQPPSSQRASTSKPTPSSQREPRSKRARSLSPQEPRPSRKKAKHSRSISRRPVSSCSPPPCARTKLIKKAQRMHVSVSWLDADGNLKSDLEILRTSFQYYNPQLI